VQEVVAAKAHYRANRAGVITNAQLTKDAKTLAQENMVSVFENVVPDALYKTQSRQARGNILREDGREHRGAKIGWSIVLGVFILVLIWSFFDNTCSGGKSVPSSEKVYEKSGTGSKDQPDKAYAKSARTSTETEETVPEVRYRVIVNEGRVRKGPGTDTDTIILVHLNDELKGTGRSEKVGNTIWYEVYYDDSGNPGWSSEIVVSPVNP